MIFQQSLNQRGHITCHLQLSTVRKFYRSEESRGVKAIVALLEGLTSLAE